MGSSQCTYSVLGLLIKYVFQLKESFKICRCCIEHSVSRRPCLNFRTIHEPRNRVGIEGCCTGTPGNLAKPLTQREKNTKREERRNSRRKHVLLNLFLSCVLPIEIDTLEYQQTEKIETELKDVDRIRANRCTQLCPGSPSGASHSHNTI